jgi:DNA-binding beta-propeller fold protein YncE
MSIRRRVAVAAAVAVLAATVPAGAAAPTLSVRRAIGGPGFAYVYAWGAATLPDGDVLISDYWNFSVKRFASDGSLVAEYAKTTKGSGFGRHLAPYDLAVDPAARAFYFGDVDAQRTVDKYSYEDGRFLLDFGGRTRFTYPAYPAVTSDGRVVVADSRAHRITVSTSTGTELFRFGSQGTGNGRFRTPRGIAICHGCAPGGDDWLYVADSGNARGQIFRMAIGGTTGASVSFVGVFGGKATGYPVEPGRFAAGGNLRGVAVDEDRGIVYVVDAGTGFTNAFDLQGTYLRRFGGRGAGPGKFPSGGRGVTVGADGRIWVSDLGQFRVHVFGPGGRFLFQVPDPPQPPPLGGFNTASDVAVDELGYAWVVDTMNQRFQRFSPTGTPLGEWGTRGGPTALGFNYPRGIAVDDTGPGCPTYTCVLLADTDTGSVVKFDANGSPVWALGSKGAIKAWSLAVGPDGTVYAPDVSKDRIVVISAAGAQVRQFGSTGRGERQFLFPRGIAVDPTDGTLWVADSQRGDIQHLTPTGAYLGRVVPSAAGVTVRQLMDVQVAGQYLVVSDTKAHRLYLFSKSGTLVGTAGGGGRALGRMLGPMGMDVVGDRLYVAEATGNRVQEFSIGT